MKTLVETPFVSLLHEYRHTRLRQESEELPHAFDNFVDKLIDKTHNRNSLIDLYRCLIFTRAEIVSLSGGVIDADIVACVQKALTILDAEVNIIRFSIEHPQVLTAIQDRDRSPLYLAKKYTPTDLVELISSFHAAGVACYIDGRPAESSDIAKEYGRMFNMEIKDFHALKSRATNRKLKLTRFLDNLKMALIEFSQR